MTASKCKGTSLKAKTPLPKIKSKTDYSAAILTDIDFLARDLPERDWVLEGLLREESVTVINGYTGYGKTMLTLALANEVVWGGALGPWKVPDPRNALLIDAEMTEHDLQSRLRQLNHGRRMSRKPGTLYIYSEGFAYKLGLRSANLLDKRWRQTILDNIDELDIGLLVLDNLSSLARGIDENEKSDFDPINEWLIEVRNHGIAVVLLHHTGKNKKEQRGTSAHLDNLDTSLLIERPRGYKTNMGCRILITATKDRGRALNADSVILQLETMKSGRMVFKTESVEGANFAEEAFRKNPGLTLAEALDLGISKTTHYRVKKELLDDGTITLD